MATFSVTHHQRLDDVAVVQTLEATDITVGQTITLTGLGHGLNGTYIVIAVPVNLFAGVNEAGDLLYNENEIIVNQLMFQDVGDDLERSAADPFGTLTWTLTCTWLSSVAPVQEFLGISSATANDTAFLTTCVAAANAWCFRRRVQAGYHDSLTTAPDSSVLLGTTLYAAGLYRERGTTGDSYASFGDMTGPPLMTLGRVNQLLGIKRSQCA
jgi:hypothetical protein